MCCISSGPSSPLRAVVLGGVPALWLLCCGKTGAATAAVRLTRTRRRSMGSSCLLVSGSFKLPNRLAATPDELGRDRRCFGVTAKLAAGPGTAGVSMAVQGSHLGTVTTIAEHG